MKKGRKEGSCCRKEIKGKNERPHFCMKNISMPGSALRKKRKKQETNKGQA